MLVIQEDCPEYEVLESNMSKLPIKSLTPKDKLDRPMF
jgi:hypothetical protein